MKLPRGGKCALLVARGKEVGFSLAHPLDFEGSIRAAVGSPQLKRQVMPASITLLMPVTVVDRCAIGKVVVSKRDVDFVDYR